MAITLGDLRTYCAEIASHDVSGATAQREFNTWINGALQRLYTERSWHYITKKHKIFLEVEESGSEMTLTEGSRSISLGGAETFDSKYLPENENWSLHVDSDSLQSYKLASIDDSPTNQNATLEEGGNWPNSSASGADYHFVRDVYPLPDEAKEVFRVNLLQSQLVLQGLTPWEFDQQRQATPTQRGGNPRFFTIRQGNIEIWPAPGDDYKTLEITYRRAAPRYATSDADSTEVAWPEEWQDLLEKAILMEAAFLLADSSPVPYGMAKQEYIDRLRIYEQLDSQARDLAGPLSPRMGRPRNPWGIIWSESYDGPVIDRDGS